MQPRIKCLLKSAISLIRLVIYEMKESIFALKDVTAYGWTLFLQQLLRHTISDKLRRRMLKVKDYKEWTKMAEMLDQLE